MNKPQRVETHEEEKDENCTGRAKADFDETIAQQPDTFSTKEDQGCSSYILMNKPQRVEKRQKWDWAEKLWPFQNVCGR